MNGALNRRIEGKKVFFSASIEACTAFYGPPPSSEYVVGFKERVGQFSASNLFWTTRHERAMTKRRTRKNTSVNKICPASGKILATFSSIKEAAESISSTPEKVGKICSNITGCINNPKRQTACGYVWRHTNSKVHVDLPGEIFSDIKKVGKIKIKQNTYLGSQFGNVIGKKSRNNLRPATCRGYLTVGLITEDREHPRLNISVHRLIWQLFNGEIPRNRQVDHRNGITHDNRLSNLRLLSAKENVQAYHALKTKKARETIANSTQ
jgi:hypothetical protein